MTVADTALITLGWMVLPAQVFEPENKLRMWRLLVGINLGLMAIRITVGGSVINKQLIQQLLRRPKHEQENSSNAGT